MPVKYSDVALPLATAQLQSWLDTYLSTEGVAAAEVLQWPPAGLDHLPVPPLVPRRELKLGVLSWPVGASNWATFYAVVNSSKLAEIREAVGDPVTAATLVLNDGVHEDVTAFMWLHSARPLMQCRGEDEELYLLTLVDDRFWWQFRSATISDSATWANLFDDYSIGVGNSVAPDTIDAAFKTPSSRWQTYYRYLPAQIDAAAHSIGQKVVMGRDQIATTQNYDTALDSVAEQYELYKKVAGGYFQSTDLRRTVPDTVRVLFRKSTPDPHLVDVTLDSLALPEYEDSTGLTGSYAVLLSDYDFTGSNTTECEALADKLAAAWYGWRLADLDVQFAGLVPWTPTGADWLIEWSHTDTLVGTRIRREPFTHQQTADFGTVPEDSTDCSQAAGWNERDCLALTVVSANGRCSGIDTTQELTLTWRTRTRRWKSGDGAVTTPTEDDFVYDFGLGPVEFWVAEGVPKLTINGRYGVYAGCDGDCVLFRFGGSDFCGGTANGCEDNTFVVSICCTCCDSGGYTTPGWYCINGVCEYLTAIPCNRTVTSGPYATAGDCGSNCCTRIRGWGGAGWYCVRVNATTCAPVELLVTDQCNSAITICSGPYATEAAAEAACGCLECTETTAAIVTIRGAADGPCGVTSACGNDSINFDSINGSWTITGTFSTVPSGCGSWGGEGNGLVGGIYGPAREGAFGVGCIPDFLNILASVQTNPVSGTPYAFVDILIGPDGVAQYQGSIASCCGSHTLTKTSDAGCGVLPGTITVQLVCSGGRVDPRPEAQGMDEFTQNAGIDQLFRAAELGVAVSDPGMTITMPNLGDPI